MRQGKLTESALERAWRAYAEALEADYTTVLDRVMVMHSDGLLTEPIIVTKHMAGRHDQRTHTPHLYRGRGATFKRAGSPEALEAAYSQLGLSEDDLARMLWVPGADKQSIWVRAEESEIEPGTYRLNTTVNWRAGPDNADVGTAARKFFIEDGRRVVENQTLGINQTGHGLGSILYTNQIRMLQQRGYHKVVLEANDSIGRYAWGRKGFDFASKPEGYKQKRLDRANEQFPEWAEQAMGLSSDDIGGWPTFTSAQDIADYDPGRGTWVKGSQIENEMVRQDYRMHLGKAYMLDQMGLDSWHGELVLNE